MIVLSATRAACSSLPSLGVAINQFGIEALIFS
jgi:hypothetical protein